jgi:hypothetical protein
VQFCLAQFRGLDLGNSSLVRLPCSLQRERTEALGRSSSPPDSPAEAPGGGSSSDKPPPPDFLLHRFLRPRLLILSLQSHLRVHSYSESPPNDSWTIILSLDRELAATRLTCPVKHALHPLDCLSMLLHDFVGMCRREVLWGARKYRTRLTLKSSVSVQSHYIQKICSSWILLLKSDMNISSARLLHMSTCKSEEATILTYWLHDRPRHVL